MHDTRGVYFYPNPAHKTTRMYVRESPEGIEFRLYSSENPDIWERHGWITREVVRQAAALYTGANSPLLLYDEDVAREVLRQAKTTDPASH